MIQFGLRLHDAEKLPIEQVLPLVRQKGFSCVHLALSKSLKEVPNTPSALTPGYAAYLRRLFAKNELDIAVLGNYLNLAHPDADALHGVTIAIEPVVKHIVYDARRARTVLDEIGSPNLQILLDPVNLLNMENVDRREEVFAEAIELLGKDVAMIHFKDFLRQDAGGQLAATGAGQGGMGDYRTILRFAKEQKPYVFATLENTTPENAVQCLHYLQKQYDEC